MAHPGTLHRYTPRLVALEHTPTTPPTHTLLWIGGLGDGLLTVPYPTTLSHSLPPSWSLAEVLISSSYRGWATSSLARDARELASCVAYFRALRPAPGSKIVLMGHSTGCQDIMAYLSASGSKSRPKLDGAILQAGISDREALVSALPPDVYAESVKVAQEWVEQGKGADVLPLSVTTRVFGSAVSADRWLSLTSPDKRGADDYFSSDLEDAQLEETFGKIGESKTPLLFLLGGSDEHMPPEVDKGALLERWARVVRDGGGVVDKEAGGVVEGASHNLDGDPEKVVGDLVGRVGAFLGRVERGELGAVAHL
ncbi:DUF1749-domain-containing protein [Mytilinidion resinicola]|uniref:DUF1749-domain-containing protein n=1 Tax=Mytilinidion resinicola TaxID=574789 RepID=A0A6A6ZBP6_9PEZI|nr:DUF1749-domain-containing protein [Mytilinidion resinicola]KAF2817734.1 DUF1749-domain-containing protein [Mytilinidion resinicola]